MCWGDRVCEGGIVRVSVLEWVRVRAGLLWRA